MFTRVLLFVFCCLPVLILGWPRTPCLGVMPFHVYGLHEEERLGLNEALFRLKDDHKLRVLDLRESFIHSGPHYASWYKPENLMALPLTDRVDYLLSGSLEHLGDSLLVVFRLWEVNNQWKEQLQVITLPREQEDLSAEVYDHLQTFLQEAIGDRTDFPFVALIAAQSRCLQKTASFK